ncbi:MAG: hypothetical protein UV73_C0008G0030 [Candidatus Gottesmanbacteria bacterium GW2011_GWA2_43_14]|uniref:PIN domain-containing protein n=1 Tax=Candidatus Gottesmanbacteria bacterium GW2011_GWA2_43_14 TaxID=1618443 RepID=A0A0G1DI46_9BACT|nr:MAG: hypothetical protein UV73_C0008G0030 [Candidatus Gottesmanbacteria bacterium GW2011_GWA2_43_14]
MAKIFLDANYFIRVITKRSDNDFSPLTSNLLFISPLSVHIFYYVYKIRVPDGKILKLMDFFNIISLTDEIITRSGVGPTTDLEDNVQLHSASAAGCSYFLTQDRGLLRMKFFGKTAVKAEF